MDVAVRFKVHHDIYNAGEIAGFVEEKAKELVAKGVADIVSIEKKVVEEVKRAHATIEELEAELKAGGYRAFKKLARERFDGKHGEEARYLGLEVEADDEGQDDSEDLQNVLEEASDNQAAQTNGEAAE